MMDCKFMATPIVSNLKKLIEIIFDSYLVVFGMWVKFSEKHGSMKFIQEIINNWDVKFVLDNQLIESLEIRTHTPSSFLIQYHDHW